MASIAIESVGLAGLYHAYLVYKNDEGEEFVIRGGPHPDALPPFSGSLDLQINIPLEKSLDARAPARWLIRTDTY